MKKSFNFKSFESLAEYLDSVPSINYGGCGISAYFIYEFFKSEGKKPKIVFRYRSWDECYSQNQDALKNNGQGVAPGHAMVKVGDKYYDSRGETVFPYADKGHQVSLKFLLNALKADNWNEDFDRNQEVPKMEKKIGINLPTS